jgi:hypothetical protein
LKRRLFILVGICVVGAAAWLWTRDPYSQHFRGPLPSGTKLLHYEKSRAGFDVSYVFVFEAPDDQLLNQLINEWSLKPSVPNDHETMSFVDLHPPSWWPGQKDLESISVQYEWIDKANERYRSVWLDRDKRLLYAEYGRW